MLDVYYAIGSDDSIWVTEKTYFDSNKCMQDNDTDRNYIKIENAMNDCGYPRLMESNYENLDEDFNHEQFVAKLATHGINMIYNKDLED